MKMIKEIMKFALALMIVACGVYMAANADTIPSELAVFITVTMGVMSLIIVGLTRKHSWPSSVGGSHLDTLAGIHMMTRIYYGDNYRKKPNDYCRWVEDGTVPTGWYENDVHLRTRISETIL